MVEQTLLMLISAGEKQVPSLVLGNILFIPTFSIGNDTLIQSKLKEL